MAKVRISFLRGSLGWAISSSPFSHRMIVFDPAAYQQVADQLDILSRIRRGLAQAKRGEGQTVDEVFDELEMEA